MKKTLFVLFCVWLLPVSLLSAEEQESKSSRYTKIPFSFRPSGNQDSRVDYSDEEHESEKKKNSKRKRDKEKWRSRRRHFKKKYKYLINSWEPYWVDANEIEESKYVFFQTNIGAAFLYFDRVNGNFGGSPSNLFQRSGSIPFKGRLRYNKTPIYEFLLGYQAIPWVSAAISYQHQSAVTIFTKFIDSQNTVAGAGNTVTNAQGQFKANFAMDAFMLKGYVEMPWPMVWRLTAFSPYVGAGVGIGWQSWTAVENDLPLNFRTGGFQNYMSSQIVMRSKYSANLVWGADAGIKIQSAKPSNHFCIRLGCKYNQWGQARSIGKLRDQGAAKFAILKPFRIRTIFSFAPYAGFQWNIPNSSFSLPPDKVGGQSTNTWVPYFADGDELQLPRALFAQFTGGVGFLYFAGVRGNLTLGPTNYQQYGQCPGKFSFNYNRTPVVEYVFGLRLSPWFKVGISKQFHSNIYIQTLAKQNINSSVPTLTQFQGNLNLLSGGVKIYLEIPKPMIWKNLCYTYFVSGSVGPSWQSWNRMGVIVKTNGNFPFAGIRQGSSYIFPLRSKVVPNVYAMVDMGLKIKNARFDVNFYLVTGCKYTFWGAARNLGQIDQQYPSYRQGLTKPLSIRTLYSFVPYLGVQWDFGNLYKYTHKKSYVMDGKDVDSWLPFITPTDEGLYRNKPVFAQVNTGIGFLYFERLRSNLGGVPSSSLGAYGLYEYTDTPSYNRTPLFEFIIGRRIISWLAAALSYQTQGSVAISTEPVRPTATASPNGNFSNTRAQFEANFRVDAIMPKVYFYSPLSMVWRRVITTPYIAAGVGVGWQTWSRIDVYRLGVLNLNGTNTQMDQPLNQRVSANVVWMVDIGMRSSVANPGSKVTTTLGIKFNDWGQARSMGRSGTLSGSKTALFKPMHIRMVYSFAPYFGVQFDF